MYERFVLQWLAFKSLDFLVENCQDSWVPPFHIWPILEWINEQSPSSCPTERFLSASCCHFTPVTMRLAHDHPTCYLSPVFRHSHPWHSTQIPTYSHHFHIVILCFFGWTCEPYVSSGGKLLTFQWHCPIVSLWNSHFWCGKPIAVTYGVLRGL